MAPQVVALLLVLVSQAPESPCIPGTPTEACEHALLVLSLNLEEQLYNEKIDRVRAEKKLLLCSTSSQAPTAPSVAPPADDPNLPVWAWIGILASAVVGGAAVTWAVTR